MHEASVALAIIDALREEWERNRWNVLKKVRLRIGKARGIMKEALIFAFDASKAGTIAEDAVIEIEEVPLRGRCQQCNAEFVSDDGVFLVCPRCKSPWVDCISGRELEIVELEIGDMDEGKGS